jgi:hypothetical protein
MEPNIQLLPPPSSAIQLTPLLGGAPSEHMQTLQSLYTAQIATIVWIAESDNPLEVVRRNVIVGIALRKSDCDDVDKSSQYEKEMFRGVMKMLQHSLANN